MSRKIFLRVGSILFMLAGVAYAYMGWIIAGGLFDSSFNGGFSYITYRNIIIAYGVLVIFGLGSLISQALSQRHWLGWLGVALSLIGMLMLTVTATIIYTPQTYPIPERLFYVLALLGSPLFSLGVVFWAVDMPNTSQIWLAQKAAMGLIALVPSFQYAILFGGVVVPYSRQLTYLLPTGLSGLSWIALGISVLLSSFSTETVSKDKPKASFADSSVDMVISPIPPEEA
jgi:hypothetical protein